MNTESIDRRMPNGRGAVLIRTLLSLAVSAAFIWLSLRSTDLRAVAGAMTSAQPAALLGYFVILLVQHVIRTVRWGWLLESAGHVGFRRLNSATAIGFMLLVVLPLRLGELARPLLVSRTERREGSQLKRSAATASCVVERVIDGLAVALLGLVALHWLGATGSMAAFARRASWVIAAMFLSLCVCLVCAVVMRNATDALLRRLLQRLAPARADKIISAFASFRDALQVGSFWRGAGVILLTVTFWALHVVGFMLLAPSFGFSLTPLMAATVLAIQAVGVMVPAGPGMVGTSQFFTQAGVSIFVPGALTIPAVAARAVAYANIIWLLQFVQQVGVGLLFWYRDRVSLARLIRIHTGDHGIAAPMPAPSELPV